MAGDEKKRVGRISDDVTTLSDFTELWLDGPMDAEAKRFIRNEEKANLDKVLWAMDKVGAETDWYSFALNLMCELRIEKARRKKTEKAFDNLINHIKSAFDEYNSPKHNRWEQRAKAFCAYWTATNGKRKEKTNKGGLYNEYISLVHGEWDMDTFEIKNPMGRWEALEELAKRHNLASAESVLEQIRGHVREMSKENPGYCSPGFLPGRKPSDLK